MIFTTNSYDFYIFDKNNFLCYNFCGDFMNYVYILKCSDGTLYTGWTTDLEKRIAAHNDKKGAKYTRGRTPVTLFYFETYDTKSEALSREAVIKRMTKKEKLSLKDENHSETP